MTGSPSLRHLRDLGQAGFTVLDVDSTQDHVVLRLEDGDRRATIELSPEEALQMLSAKPAPNSRTVFA